MDIESSKERIEYLEKELSKLEIQKEVLWKFAEFVADSFNPKNLQEEQARSILQELQRQSIMAMGEATEKPIRM